MVFATHVIFNTSDTDGLGNVTFPLLYLIIGALRMASMWIIRQWHVAKPKSQTRRQHDLKPAILQPVPLGLTDKEESLIVDVRLNDIESQYFDLKNDMAQILEHQQSALSQTATPTTPDLSELLHNINSNMSRLLENETYSHSTISCASTPDSVYGVADYNYPDLEDELVSVPLFPFNSHMLPLGIRDKRDSFLTDDDTIFEGMTDEKPENEDSGSTTPIEAIFDPWDDNKSVHNEETQDQQSNGRMYSLHGLPLTSGIKRLITRNTKFTRFSLLSGQHSFLIARDETITDILYCLFNSWTQEVTMKRFAKDPFGVLNHVITEVKPHAESYFNKKVKAYTSFILIAKKLVWEYFYHHILINATSPLERILAMHCFIEKTLRKTIYSLFLVCFLLPWNIFRIYVSVMIFVPRILFRVFIMLPLVSLWESRRTKSMILVFNTSGSDLENTNKEFPGMKKFRLASSNRVHQVKSRRLLVDKLAKHCNNDADIDFKYGLGKNSSYRRNEFACSEPVQLIYNGD